MSTLFVQSSLRNTKSFASKYSCLWRRGGAILCIRNHLLRNEGLPCRLSLGARGLGSLNLWRQFACAVSGTSQLASHHLFPASVDFSGFYSRKVQRGWVRTASWTLCLPRTIYLHPQLLPRWLRKDCSRAEPAEMSYLKPRAPSQPGASQTLPFHTLS